MEGYLSEVSMGNGGIREDFGMDAGHTLSANGRGRKASEQAQSQDDVRLPLYVRVSREGEREAE